MIRALRAGLIGASIRKRDSLAEAARADSLA
jgi:hypothetical protein